MGVIIRQSFWNMVVTYAGFVLGAVNTLFLYTHFFSTENYGLVMSLVSVSAIVMPFIAVGMNNALVRFLPRGADKDRLYYVLAPVGDGSGRIYAPTDNQKITMRKVISREEADQLIEDMPKIEQLWVPDDRQREARYKEAMNTCDYRAWVSIVKTLYIRKQERTAQGKKITALDERYMRTAENELYSELSLTLGIPKDEMEQYIRERLTQ